MPWAYLVAPLFAEALLNVGLLGIPELHKALAEAYTW